MIVRLRKDQHYYIIRMYQDLVGDWTVTQCWGSSACDEDASVCHTVVDSYLSAKELLQQINQTQTGSGYSQVSSFNQQLDLKFD